MDPVGQIAKIAFEVLPVRFHRHPVYLGPTLPQQPAVRPFGCSEVNVVQQRRKSDLSRRFGRLIRPNLLNRLHADTLSTINNKSNGYRGIALSYLSESRAYARQMGIRLLISGSCVQNWPMSIM
jgi:hypothetical protein